MVVGASGNVGPFAVQIAKAMGAQVTAVASTAKLDFVRSLGADHVIDYTTTDPTRTGERYHWIVDVDAHHSLLRWRHAVHDGGVYQALGGSAAWMLCSAIETPVLRSTTGKRMGLMLDWKPFRAEDVARLTELVAAGQLRPVIDRRFPLDEVVEALRYVDEGRATGKVIVIP
jgi:NADPH:quinone reductase-like Zn-dependent oxidoreductase